ncbi:uncharacterized protein A1O5_08291 [Cladophialophora psammophila CBS 110553]|uniref:AAA+ ATPase domain-containing protein n=1 Tax=Cladophialophora psammophila CBS 110553 TaxID=1182543 RepID=W9WKR6_9EURO|nr:uncharacterized protein A1O5_08291 [Cladophialophora psammophila CBS 110553]EXJ68498.1 hypothetical protein A1O5_08291 [Cladophialophora psammophila CBS 110553]
MINHTESISYEAKTVAQKNEDREEVAGAPGSMASEERPAKVNERHVILNAPEADATENIPEENDQFSGADSDSETYDDSDSNDVANLNPESDSELDSDSDTESDREILRYLDKLNGYRRWKGASGTHNDLRDSLIGPDDIQVTFDDVHITPDAIEALDPILLQLEMPDQFKFGSLAQHPSTGILLYGPPGTGKTQLVRAFGKTANATVLSLTGADFRHNHVGESEKRIKQIFSYARDHKGSFVIFIDEADSVFRSRSLDGNSASYAADISQFLAEMDGINSTGLRNVIVIAASNRPFDIDEGILRRLNRRILVDVPTKDDREAILRIHLKNEELADDVNLSELARLTGDYTGSDLRDLVYEAALVALREIRFHSMNGNPKLARPVKIEGQRRLLQWKHFRAARKQIRPSPKSDTAEKVREFHNRFGNMSQKPAASSLKHNIVNNNRGEAIQNHH